VTLRRILITGSGGIGGVNFVRALRLAERMRRDEEMYIAGTDYNIHHIEFPDLDARYRTPRHSDPGFLEKLVEIIEREGIEFLHPHPSVEAREVARRRRLFESRGVRLYLPRPDLIGMDKTTMNRLLVSKGVPAPKTHELSSLEDVEEAFERLGAPLWLRAKTGAGGRLSLKVNSPEEARLWIRLNALQGRAGVSQFILQEYLPGRDIAFDSLWHRGRLITSYARERIEYPFRHISLTGITGTPSVAKTLVSPEVNEVGISAVKAVDDEPNGFFSVDLREDGSGLPRVTEVDAKWHTTAPLWGYAFSLAFGDLRYNLAYQYLRLGYGEEPDNLPEVNLFPEGYILIRQMDCGAILLGEGRKLRVI